MIVHKVKVSPSKIHLPKKNQLAWKIAEIASDNEKLNKDAIDMVINRIIDNASVAIASLNRKPVISSREMALKHSKKNGISTNKHSTSNLKKTLLSIEKQIIEFEKEKELLENEMLKKDFFDNSNNERVKEVNKNLKEIKFKISLEEKNWEDIFEKLEISNQ